MTGEKCHCQLGDVAELVRGVSYKSDQLLHDEMDAVPLLRATNIGNRVLDLDDVLYVPAGLVRDAQFLQRFDTVIAMSSGSRKAVGRLALLRRDWTGCVGAFCGIIRPVPEKIVPEYLGYVLQSPDFRTRIETYAVGTAIMNLSRDRLLGFSMELPDVSEQRAIASILGALDDKIELNRKMSQTLDEIAQAIFKSVFSGMAESADRSSVAAARFDSFVTMTKGRSYKSVELAESDTALVTLKSFMRFGGYRPDGLKGYTGSYKPEQVIEPGEIVVALTDVTQAADVIGNPAIVLPDPAYRVLVASLDTAVVRPMEGVPRSFIYFLMRTSAFKQHARAHTTGTTVLHLNPKHLLAYPLRDVDLDEARSFDVGVSPMLNRLRLCAAESATLEGLRDTLLPRLLSGELRVRDAEKVAEEVL